MWMIFDIFRNGIRKLRTDERGIGTVEVILITIVVIGLVVLFKDSITDLVETLTQSMKDQAASI